MYLFIVENVNENPRKWQNTHRPYKEMKIPHYTQFAWQLYYTTKYFRMKINFICEKS